MKNSPLTKEDIIDKREFSFVLLEDVRSAKRLLKQKIKDKILIKGFEDKHYGWRDPKYIDMATRRYLLSVFLKEIDACFQIKDGSGTDVPGLSSQVRKGDEKDD